MVGEPVVGVYIFFSDNKISKYLIKKCKIKNNNNTAALRGYLDIK